MDVGVDPSVVWDVLRTTILGVLTGDYITLTPALWVFVGVLGAFVVTRSITRFIRARSARGGQATGPIKDITIGGVHVHHQVFGIVTMFLTGLIIITVQPTDTALDLLAVLFGVGVGLAFDEFALWWHLDDVYWSEHGRKSIDAVAWALVLRLDPRHSGPVHGVRGRRGCRQHVVAPGVPAAADARSGGDLRAPRQAGDRGARHRLPADRDDRGVPAGQARLVLGPALLRGDVPPACAIGAPLRCRLCGSVGPVARPGGRGADRSTLRGVRTPDCGHSQAVNLI